MQIKQKIFNLLTKHLYCTVEPDAVMTSGKINGKEVLYLHDKALEEAEIKNLQQEIKHLRSLWIWRIITETLKDQAQQVMFTKSKDFNDMVAGKMMLYNLGVQERIIKLIEEHK